MGARMRTTAAGPKGVYLAGREYPRVPREFVDHGYAFETTTRSAPETAATRTGTPPPRETAAEAPAGDQEAGRPVHVGGGWYELPNGDRVKGKQAAADAFAALTG